MVALETAGEESVKAIVLLSPGMAEPFVEAVGRKHERPTLLVAGATIRSQGWGGGHARAARPLAVLARVYDDAGHGTEMLERVPELTPFVVRWVKEPSRAPAACERPVVRASAAAAAALVLAALAAPGIGAGPARAADGLDSLSPAPGGRAARAR
jgi:hypothetical protein